MSSNFSFLENKWPLLYSLGATAESYVYSDPMACMFKLGLFAEKMVEIIFAIDSIQPIAGKDNSPINRINELKRQDLINSQIEDIFHIIRKNRNYAVHDAADSVEKAKVLLEFAYTLACWFMETYGDWEFNAKPFVMPVLEKPREEIIKEQEAKIEELSKIAYQKPLGNVISIEERRKKSKESSGKTKLSEKETRFFIDEQLRAAGWDADTDNIRYSKGARPEKSKNKAIAEWPTDSKALNNTRGGFADYALFIGLELVGIIEAKAKHLDVLSAISYQCADYAKNIKKEHDKYIIGNWNDYKVPFVFATNGRKYLKQLAEKSGIWFLDTRLSSNIPRVLQGFITPDGIRERLEKDIAKTNEILRNTPYDLLTDKDGLNLRKYQIRAIEEIEKALSAGKQSALLAMATGTGKTRTALGMIYRFIDSGRFKRVLFLVDRTALGEQAQDVFKEVKIEDLMTLDKIYNIKTLGEKEIDKETRIHVATVQSMVKRIIYNEGDIVPCVSDYDLIVIDEAHRGYTLDKDLSEYEFAYRDEKDFISKYRAVIEYFDAAKVAITATPALHTSEIFGKPVFTYLYREAVIEGYLVDHDAPHNIKTKLSEEGINYNIGETLAIYDPVTGEITNSDELEDELNFDVETFNKKVITEDFNRTVLEEIAKSIDPQGEGKTLIFAANDLHADMIVRILKEIYEPFGIDNDAILKITGAVDGGNKKRILEAIKKFKNEKYPNIAVTVDLLTTGIDVPQITNIVFLRRVKSRILYEQMLGRATRLCPEIGKTHFEIYDAVRLYESLQPLNTMKPVVANPKATFGDLLDGLEVLETEAQKKNQIDMIIAKLQRRKRNLSQKAIDNFVDLTKGKTPESFIQEIRELPVGKAEEMLLKNRELFEMLNEGESNNNSYLIISDKKDELISHTRGYGEGKKPEDYLLEFKEFIENNKNEIDALNIVCTRPKELTRETLKSLKMELDRHNFTEIRLNSAWREWTNEDIAADIISFIRSEALGIPLVSHEERMKNAFLRLKKAHKFTKIQLNWLDKIETFMIKESILNKETFEDGVFKANGGFNRFNAIFEKRLESLIEEFNNYLYDNGVA